MSIAEVQEDRAVTLAPPAPPRLAPVEPAASRGPLCASAAPTRRIRGAMDLLVAPASVWISLTLRRYRRRARPAVDLGLERLRHFYHPELLEQALVMPVDRMPCPPLRRLWSGRARWDLVDGLTLRDTYFVRRGQLHRQDLHAHELVHVIQWRLLGERAFLSAWLGDSIMRGYRDNRLEQIAYRVQDEFLDARRPFDAHRRVAELLVAKGLRLES